MDPMSGYDSHGEKRKRQELENAKNADFDVPIKCKARKASAVCDFPKGFEKFPTGLQNNSVETTDASTPEGASIEPYASHGEKRKRQELENAKHADFDVPIKCKARKASAVRDFPEGFENKDLVSVETTDNLSDDNVSPSALEGASIEPSVSHGEKRKREELENDKFDVPIKCKARKASAVRDFPKGFENFDTQISGHQNKVLVSVETADIFLAHDVTASALEGASIKPDVVSGESLSHSEIHELPNNLQSKELEPVVPLDHEEVSQLGVELAHSSDDEEFPNYLGTSEDESFDFRDSMENPSALNYVSEDDVRSYVSNDDSVESFKIDVGSPICQVDTPPNISSKIRRKFSVIRSYPPGCGRNIAYLSREDCEKALASSQNKGLRPEKFNVQPESLEKTVRDDLKKVTEDSVGDSEDDCIKPYEIDDGSRDQQVDRSTNFKILPDTSSKICISRSALAIPEGCGAEFSNLTKPFEEMVRNDVKQITVVAQGEEANLKEISSGNSADNLKEISSGNSADKVQLKCKDDDSSEEGNF